ncbi:MAG TPA: XdhC family protein [Vicinamibacterales bacterium]|jgi:xanthine/CO dehydrogenase XdhC/CoxF family maturation factor
MDRRETERLLEAIHQARAAGRPAAMATIVRVTGSAYRREGTRMFVRPDGTYECALSGGCLEPAVAEAAMQVIETGQPALVSYDLADDSLWGLGIGCMGAVDIRIERLEDEAITNTWLRILEHGEAAVLVTPLSGVSGRMIVQDSGATAGALSDPMIEREAAARAILRLRHPSPESAAEWIGAAELFFEVAAPPPRLVIFGAGPDAVPLVQLAHELGFAVTIVDPRETFLTPDRFPDATRICAQPGEFADHVKVGAGDFVLVMNHHVERDQESFRVGLESDAAYIGVLGPRVRYEKLLARLAAQGYVPDPGTLARVHSPVGLSVGAETPQEVAVSILGEILAIRRRFEGGFLTGSMRSLHRPDDTR